MNPDLQILDPGPPPIAPPPDTPAAAARLSVSPHYVKTWRNVTVLVVALMALLVTLHVLGTGSFRHRAASIRTGDSKSQVLAALGQPTAMVPGRGASPNTSLHFPQPQDWCYGSRYRCRFALWRQFPYFLRIEDRSWSFCPWPRDTVVGFGAAGRVIRIEKKPTS